MKNNITEVVFILDRSGSMSGLESDTIGGFNSIIAKQKQEDGRAYVTTVLFDSHMQRIHDRLDIQNVPKMTEKDYVPQGCTALLDAVGETIRHIAHIHKYSRPEDVPEKTVVIITTDGMENSSHRYTREKVKKLIEHEQTKYGWEFIFMGANIDAAETAEGIGIQPERAANYIADDDGIELCMCAVNEVVCSARRREVLDPAWKANVEKDHAKRHR